MNLTTRDDHNSGTRRPLETLTKSFKRDPPDTPTQSYLLYPQYSKIGHDNRLRMALNTWVARSVPGAAKLRAKVQKMKTIAERTEFLQLHVLPTTANTHAEYKEAWSAPRWFPPVGMLQHNAFLRPSL